MLIPSLLAPLFLAQTRTATPGMPADFRDTSPTRNLLGQVYGISARSHRSWLLFRNLHRPGLQHPECPLPQDESSPHNMKLPGLTTCSPLFPRRLLAQTQQSCNTPECPLILRDTSPTRKLARPGNCIILLAQVPRKASPSWLLYNTRTDQDCNTRNALRRKLYKTQD